MSEIQPLDSAVTTTPEEHASTSASTDPMSEIQPLDTAETTTPEELVSTGTSQDPITGVDPAADGYTNTSNGNQIAVLSTIDYSTNVNILNSSTTTDVSNHNTSITNNYYATETGPIPANHSSPTNNYYYYYYTTNNTSTPSSTSTNTSNQDPITGSTSLMRSAVDFRFVSSDYFSRNGIRRVDRIFGFNTSSGDMLAISRRVFKGIGSMDFEIAANRKQLRAMAKSDADIIYQESSGQLFFNANGEEKGFGKSGGMFAILEGSPLISSSNLMLI